MRLQPVVFPTKVDLWLVVVLSVALLGSMWTAVFAFLMDPATGWFTLATVVGIVLIVAALTIPTAYVVDEHALVVRFGLFRKAIPLASIERVHRTRNPLSSPAWSLDRLGVTYRTGGRRGYLMISPVRQDAFLELLAERAGLARQGAELTRAVPSA